MIGLKSLLALGLFCLSLASSPLRSSVDAPREETIMKQGQLYRKNHAEIVDSKEYPTADVFVADVVLDRAHGYEIDDTGVTPIDQILQKAIDELYQNGGGTIYLPHGRYSITSRIEIKPYVNLRGDYKDPDLVEDGDYGTLILCNVAPTSSDTGARNNVFRMDGSTGISGFTFFYPLQYLDVYQEYAFTIEVPGGMNDNMCTVYNIENVTFLNSYKGIVASMTPATYYSITHEQLHISNVKGTCLRIGAYLTNSSEVGTMDNIIFSNSYWAKAGSKFNAPDRRNIDDFTLKNGVGMILGDLEWQEITNVTLEKYHTGVYFIDGTRNTSYHMAFIGQFYNLKVLGSQYAVYVQKLYENMGIEFFKSILEGSEYSLISNSPQNYGCLKLSHVTLDGKVTGLNIFYDKKTYDDIGLIPWKEGTYQKPKPSLFNAKTDYGADNSGQSDCSTALQKALDDAKENGGGVVYLPAGFYRLDHPVTIYGNTQLRGCFNMLSQCQRLNSRGTFLLAYYGRNAQNPDTDQALIEIKGNDAGVSGLRIGYPALNPYEAVYTKDSLAKYPYTIRGEGEGIYVTNVYIPGAYNGIEIKGDRFLLKKALGCFYHNAYKVCGNDGLISDCLCNGACTLKPGSEMIQDYDAWGSDRVSKLWDNVYSITRAMGTVLTADGCENLAVNHLFSFAYNTLIDAKSSKITAINLGFDSQPVGAGQKFKLTKSDLTCYNSLRDNCSQDGTYVTKDEQSRLSVYNIILLLPNNGGRFKANIINNQFVSVDPFTDKAGFELEKIWQQEIDFAWIDYKEESPVSSSSEAPLPPQSQEPIASSEAGEKTSSGCGGSFASISVMGASLLGASALCVRKKGHKAKGGKDE